MGSQGVPDIDMRLSIQPGAAAKRESNGPTTLAVERTHSSTETPFSTHLLRHSDALRRRAVEKDGQGDVVYEEVEDHTAPQSRTHHGPFEWRDPLDTITRPLEAFLAKPECLPILVVVVACATFTTSAVLWAYDSKASVLQTCQAVAPDKSYCATGLPFISYFSVGDDASRWVYLAGGLLTAILHLGTVTYIASSQHRRITTYGFEFPELIDPNIPLNQLNCWNCCCGRVVLGWPATTLTRANFWGVLHGALTAVCIGGQAVVRADDHYHINAAFAVGFVVFACLNIGTTIRMQLTLNVLPTQDPRNLTPRGRNRTQSALTTTEEDQGDFYLDYSFDDLPMRLQVKLVCGLLTFASLVAFVLCEFAFFDHISNATRQHLQPSLQYATIFFYFCCYITFSSDIRTSGMVWEDYDFLEVRSREKLYHQRQQARSVARESFRQSQDVSMEQLSRPTAAPPRSCLGIGDAPTEVPDALDANVARRGEDVEVDVSPHGGEACYYPRDCEANACVVQ